jgi:hypothetical protein
MYFIVTWKKEKKGENKNSEDSTVCMQQNKVKRRDNTGVWSVRLIVMIERYRKVVIVSLVLFENTV